MSTIPSLATKQAILS